MPVTNWGKKSLGHHISGISSGIQLCFQHEALSGKISVEKGSFHGAVQYTVIL